MYNLSIIDFRQKPTHLFMGDDLPLLVMIEKINSFFVHLHLLARRGAEGNRPAVVFQFTNGGGGAVWQLYLGIWVGADFVFPEFQPVEAGKREPSIFPADGFVTFLAPFK